MVAHRLSTIIAADKLIVFDKSKIVQIGTHRTLVNDDGYYRESLWHISYVKYKNMLNIR